MISKQNLKTMTLQHSLLHAMQAIVHCRICRQLQTSANLLIACSLMMLRDHWVCVFCSAAKMRRVSAMEILRISSSEALADGKLLMSATAALFPATKTG